MIRFLVTLLFSVIIPVMLYPQGKYEIRAVWLTTLGGMDWPARKAVSETGIAAQKKELADQLDVLKSANFNTVIFQVRQRGSVIYPSSIEPFSECLTGHAGRDPKYDPLKFAIEECHKRGLEFHAWIVCIPIGNKRQVDMQKSRCVVKKHPELCKLFNGTYYLDPGNPGTADYLCRMVREIVSNYDVDGIHLDYIRYPEQGKNFPDRDTYRRYGNRQEIGQWRRDNITRIVRSIYAEVKSLKPWVKVSSSPIGKYNDTDRYSSYGWNAYEAVYQDAQKWLEEGINDMIFPMMYYKKNQFYPFALDWQENKGDRWVVPGLGIYFLDPEIGDWTMDEVIRQIYFTRGIGLDGQAYFRNRFLMDNTKGLLDELKSRFYALPAVVPPMTWIDSTAPSTPSPAGIDYDGKSTCLKWDPAEDNDGSSVYYRIYASNIYPVDIEQPQNMIVTRTDKCQYTYTPEYPWNQRTYWAVTAVDRFGNESLPSSFNRKGENELNIYGEDIPEIPEGCTLIVTDVTGTEILRTQNPRIDLCRISCTGIFKLNILSTDGTVTPLGMIVR